jgi:hypothetical protein
LDKNVIRHALNALARLELGQPLAADLSPLDVLRAVRDGRARGFISPELANILRHHSQQPIVRLALDVLPVFRPTHYFKRWAKRLRGEGFSREDAKVIALGTFGVNEAETRFGVDAIVTGDLSLIHNYERRFSFIQRRLHAMTAQLSEPYCYAALPTAITSGQAIELLEAEQ